MDVKATIPGSPFPLGATAGEGGTNFAVASATAEGILLCLFDGSGGETQVPLQEVDAGVWHTFVPGPGLVKRTATAPRGHTTRLGARVATRQNC